jgi:putative sigma-54 modulation protein
MSDVSVTFRHLEASSALKAYAEEKAAKINKYFGGLNEVNVVLSLEKHRYTAEITLKAGRTTVNAREETSDMYSAIDLVVDKINRQIKKYKDKMKDHKAATAGKKVAGRSTIAPPREIGDYKQPEIIKTERVSAKPLSLDEAVMQLELAQNDFLVFINDETEKINVIYRRKDGDLGLVEPEE